MATNIMGLFGATPEEIRARRMQQQQQEVANMANLTDPRAFMAYVGSGLGGQLANTVRDVGGMFGLRSQEEEQAMQEQEVLREAQQSGLSGSALYKRLADISADPRRAFVLRQQAAQMEAAEAKAEQEKELNVLELKKARRAEEEAIAATARKRQQEEAVAAAITAGASDKDLLKVYSQYAPPDVAFDALNKRILANEKKEADILARQEKHQNKMEELQQKAADKEFQLRLANASREAIADENRRSREMMANATIASREMLSRERTAASLEQARLVSELRNKNMPKDAAEAAADIDAVLSNQARGLELINRINSPEVSEKAFTNFNTVKHFLNAQVGVATDESILVEDTRTWIREQVNTILQAAKGVQTEGDAQRAEQIIAATTGKLTKRGVLNAIQKVINFSDDIAKRKDNLIYNRTGRRYIQTTTPAQLDPAGIR